MKLKPFQQKKFRKKSLEDKKEVWTLWTVLRGKEGVHLLRIRMVKSVHKIFSYYKKHGYKIIVIRRVKSVRKIFSYYKKHGYQIIVIRRVKSVQKIFSYYKKQLGKLSFGARSDQSNWAVSAQLMSNVQALSVLCPMSMFCL